MNTALAAANATALYAFGCYLLILSGTRFAQTPTDRRARLKAAAAGLALHLAAAGLVAAAAAGLTK